jgi:hypothetical protein
MNLNFKNEKKILATELLSNILNFLIFKAKYKKQLEYFRR